MTKRVTILLSNGENPRIAFGCRKLQEQLVQTGYDVQILSGYDIRQYRDIEGDKLYIGLLHQDSNIAWLQEEELLLFHTFREKSEGFYLATCPGSLTVVCGTDETGVLYGCMELRDRIREEHQLPEELAVFDAPEFKLRGPAVGLQKTKIEPPRRTYEYPITPSRFPWFYDKPLWETFLDELLDMRCNVLYIWSGHPFSSLVKLEDYPEALEVTEEEFRLNREVFTWLAQACDRRGIWLVLKFYNIHIPYPFAIAHNLDPLQSSIHPLVADYTEKSIIAFIKEYPHIGLMVCLGEALRGTQNKTDWFVDTIVPAVKKGMQQAGLEQEPPIILRGHDCDAYGAMQLAQKQYKNLYTMWKYNGEGLTTYLPRGNWQKTHLELAGAGTTHIMNVHILADLEPFRYMAPLYIQKCVQAGQYRLGANGLHLYPLFYWDWPYSPDKTQPRLLQMNRDKIWFQAWFRYAWKPDRDEETEKLYWTRVFSQLYGVSLHNASLMLKALESAGRCAPEILGRVGITEGNRQTLSLGMTMSQLTNVKDYRPNLELWNSVAIKGEQPDTWIEREKAGKPHIGETPYDMVRKVTDLAQQAKEWMEVVMETTPDACAELVRIEQDVQAIYHMSNFYAYKVLAAMEVLRYKAGMDQNCYGDLALLRQAAVYLESSLKSYRKLTDITDKTYLYANSMQTPQRRIPFPDGEKYCHWRDCEPLYEKEYECFLRNIRRLENHDFCAEPEDTPKQALQPVGFRLAPGQDSAARLFRMQVGESISLDTERKLRRIAPELRGLTGIQTDFEKAFEGTLSVSVELDQDSYILIGYMKDKALQWLQVPDLETNTHADDREGLAILYRGAVQAEGCPIMDIHAFRYEAGVHTLYFGTGAFLIAGVISAEKRPLPREVDYDGKVANTLDWLYE